MRLSSMRVTILSFYPLPVVCLGRLEVERPERDPRIAAGKLKSVRAALANTEGAR